MKGRTDMAFETHSRLQSEGKVCEGVRAKEWKEEGVCLREVTVLTAEGEKAIGKPRGRYFTLELPANWQVDSSAAAAAPRLLARELRELLPREGTVLVAGLGNMRITPDSIGPLTVDGVIATRHLHSSNPDIFGHMRSVCAVKAGVLGCTGVESAEIIRGVCSRVRPSAVIAVDALASLSTDRLGRTFQLSDTGVVPGSGACNARTALSRDTLGLPVIALGVPTVVDADTIAREMTGEETEGRGNRSFLVTPNDIDLIAEKSAKILSHAINMALHGEMTAAEIEQFLC